MTILEDKFSGSFFIYSSLQTNSRGIVRTTLLFFFLKVDKSLCVQETIMEYCEQTKELRGQEKQCLLSYMPQHREVRTDSVAG